MFPQIKFRQTNVGADRGVCWSFMFGVWGGGVFWLGFCFGGFFWFVQVVFLFTSPLKIASYTK